MRDEEPNAVQIFDTLAGILPANKFQSGAL
jgi:hypothetical protein